MLQTRFPAARRRREDDGVRPFAAELLEPRTLLSHAPFPDLSLLENPANPVFRLDTTFGTVDIELFSDAAPGTLAAFLDQLSLLDGGAFHRSVPGQLLQVGTFAYGRSEPVSWLPGETILLGGPRAFGGTGERVAPDAPIGPVFVDDLDPAREPLQWTVSINEVFERVRIRDPLHAPEDFARGAAALTFNLRDNPTDPIDTFMPGELFTASRVIGRVLPGPSRDVISMIAGLPTFDASLYGQGRLLNFSELLGLFPVTGGFTPNQPQDMPRVHHSVLVTDAELIKPAGAAEFFVQRLFIPEGFSAPAISEFVPIYNPGPEAVHYQLIARFEDAANVRTALGRDLVIASGTIEPGARGGVTIAGEGVALIPWGSAYALELQSTGPLSATLSHYDFGAATGENFTSDPTAAWLFADVEIGELPDNIDTASFLVWHNTADQAAEIEVVFMPQDGAGEIQTRVLTTGALRRGGLALWQLGLPGGRYAIAVTSSQPLVAAVSQYRTQGDAGASTELGVGGSPSLGGALPMVSLAGGASQVVTIWNPADPRDEHPTDPTAEVTLTFTPVDADLSPVQRVLNVAAGQSVRFDTAEIAAALGDSSFVVRFASTAPVVVRGSRVQSGDVAATGFSPFTARTWRIAEGFMDPARADIDVLEFLGVYNPNGLLTAQTDVTVTFHFTDGSSISLDFSLAPNTHLSLALHEAETLLEQAAAGRNFYSIDVEASLPVVVAFWHYDLTLGGPTPAGGFGTLADPFGDLTPLGGA